MGEFVSEEGDEADKQALQKQAFKDLVTDRLKNELARRERITHRLSEEEPLNNNDVE
jgi:hypothetical protein